MQSQLFTVRVWPEILSNGRVEWRGQVRHVTNRDHCYFREWSALVAFLERRLAEWLEEIE